MRATGKGPGTTLSRALQVSEREWFISLLGFLHLVDQTERAVDKSDKIYKVRPILDRIIPLFRGHYSHCQQLSLDEGMNQTKNRQERPEFLFSGLIFYLEACDRHFKLKKACIMTLTKTQTIKLLVKTDTKKKKHVL